MAYVDGYVVPVHTSREEYQAFAAKAAPVFKEHGALTVVECWGDDIPEGEVTSFPLAVKKEPGENVAFSWVTWPSKEARDAGWEKVMADPRMQPQEGQAMPFNGKRLIYGGFEVIVSI